VEARPGVLVVDDDVAVRTIAERILRSRGFAVFGAASAAEALACFEREQGRICVLVSDLRLQGMSGPELARALFARRADLAVVFITGGAPLTQAGDDLKRAALLSKHCTLA
jgi:FixJ family two-component response regulator